MNKINFAPHSQQRSSLHSSFSRGTLVITGTVICIMAILQIKQWTALRALRQEKLSLEKRVAPLSQFSCSKQKLQDELPALEKAVNVVERTHPQHDLFLELYQSIRTLLGTNGSLESLTLAKKKLELTIGVGSVKAAQKFLDQLAQTPTVSSLELEAIHKGATNLLCSITGTLS
jgi:hypothetical protein